MLGYRKQSVTLVFRSLPNQVDVVNHPLVNLAPFEVLYLQGWQELHRLYRMQYASNNVYIDNLYSRERRATKLVAETMLEVLGNGTFAERVVEGFLRLRVLESPEDVLSRTMGYTGPVEVVKHNHMVHEGCPGFVWNSPLMDQAAYDVRAAAGFGDNAAKYETAIIYEHVQTFRAAIAVQQRLIGLQIAALSQDILITQIQGVLKQLLVSKGTITRLCAKVAGLKCLWATEVPRRWLSEPAMPVLEEGSSTCVVKEHTEGSSDTSSCDCFVTVTPSSRSNHAKMTTGPVLSSSNSCGKGFFLRLGKVVAAAGATVFGVLASRHDPSSATTFGAALKGWPTGRPA